MSLSSEPSPSSTQSRAAAPGPTAPQPQRPSAGGVREVLDLAYPVVLTQMSVTAMHLVDSAMVGRLGATELAAVGFGGIWVWAAVCFFSGTSSGIQTFVSQACGAGERERSGFWNWQGIWAVVPAMALATAIYWIVLGPALAWLEPSDAMLPLAQGYMSQRFFGSVGLIAAMTFSSFFRGIGDTRTPLYAALVANIANAILDYGLIFGHFGLPAWGVEGAGTATALGEWINFFVLAFALQRPAVRSIYWTRVVAPDWSAIGRVLRVGIPVGGQWLLEMLSFAAFLTLVARMGDGPMAASQIFIALLSISFMQAIGLSIGVSTLVGQYVGAEQHPAVFASFWSGMKLAAVLAGVIALVLVAFPDLLLSIFTSDPEVLALGRPLLRLGALYQVFDAFAILADGALRGAGDTRWPFAIRCVLAWGFFLPAAYLLGVYLDGGLTNAWAAGVVYAFILAVILVRRFTSGAWKQIQI